MLKMAERIKSYRCIDCIHLQRDDPYISGQMALYRCSCQGRDGKVVGWVQKDNPERGLKQMGCSECNKLHPGDMFDFKGYFSTKSKRYLYCGKKGNKRILLGIPDYVYTPVPNDHFRGQAGVLRRKNFQMVMQTKEQKEYHKDIAKNIMRKHHYE